MKLTPEPVLHLFYRVVFVLCLVALLRVKAAIAAAAKSGDTRLASVLQMLRLGLALSGCSYLLHIVIVPLTGLFLLASLFSCFAGTLLIYHGWVKFWQISTERRQADTRLRAGDALLLSAQTGEPGLPPLAGPVSLALRYAREEARLRRQTCVETDHLLAGLLREPSCTAVDILSRLGVGRKNLSLALAQSPKGYGRANLATLSVQSLTPRALPLTDRSREVFTLAAQEAHRFDKSEVETEHLLLGLILMGTEPAALILFQKGITVDNIRREILNKAAT